MSDATKLSSYVSLREAITKAAALSQSSNTVQLINYSLEKTGLEEELAAKGLRAFKPLAAGSSGIVVELPEHQVMRICYNMNAFNKGSKPFDTKSFRPNALHQLHSIDTATSNSDGSLIYEIMPKLSQQEGVTAALERLIKSTKSLLTGSKSVKNMDIDVGYLADGTAYFLDPDILKSDIKHTYNPTRDKEWVIVAPGKKSKVFSFLPEGLISKQEAEFPSLMDGRIRGVLAYSDRARLEAGELEKVRAEKPECFNENIKKENLSEFIHHIFDERLYPEEAIRLMANTRQDDSTKSTALHQVAHEGTLAKPVDLKLSKRSFP